MKKNFTKKEVIGLLVLTTAITSTGSYAYFNHQYQINKVAVPNGLEKVSQLYQRITNDYVGKVQPETLIEGALKGMTEAIGDPYSVYLEKDQAKDLEDSLASFITGIGATMTMKDGKAQVASPPLKGTPAKKAGLLKDDILEEVDGKKLDGMSLDEIVSLVRGPVGTKVQLKVLRGNKSLDFTVERAKVAVESIQAKIMKENTGYLRIDTFAENTAQEFKEKATQLKKEGAKTFILDVRQNPGGLLDQVVSLSSMLLKDGQTIVKWSNKKGQQYESKATEKDALNFKLTEPLAILVDGQSASAAEILAGAIKDNQRGEVIGMKTFGKGTMQDVESGHEEKLKLTTGSWFTPNGTSVNGKGLMPTIEVSYPEFAYLPPVNVKLQYQLGDDDRGVIAIKVMLKGLGYSLDDSQIFDEKTKKAVEDYQGKNQIPITGIWDEKTSTLVQQDLMKKIQEEDVFIEKALEVLGEGYE